MRDKLHTLPGTKPGDESMVSMLLAQSVFLGIFIGAYDVAAHSLLLSTFDERIMARGYIISGLAGIILTNIYSRINSGQQFRNFSLISLIFIFALTFFIWLALIISPSKWIIFTVFIMFGPLNLVALNCLRVTKEGPFKNKQERRALPFADTGLIIGILIISFAIPVILSFRFHTVTIFLLGAFSVLIAAIIQYLVRTRYSLTASESETLAEKPEKTDKVFLVFGKDHYIRTLAIYSALSVLTAYFIQYLFMADTRLQFPVAEDMACFLGLFTGSIMIFTLLIKLFVFPYIFNNYGLRVCLLFLPVLIAFITAVIIPVGLLLGYSSVSVSGFFIFFALIAFGRLISKSLKDSVEIPSLKLINYSVGKSIASPMKSFTNGYIYETAFFFSGLILTGLGLFGFITIIHFSMSLCIIAIIWMLFTIRLYREYRKAVLKAMESGTVERSGTAFLNNQSIFKGRFSSYLNFRADYFNLITGNLKAFENNRDNRYFEEITRYALTGMDINLLPVLKKIANNTDIDEGIRHRAAEITEILQNLSGSNKSDEGNISRAIKILSGSRMPQTTELLRLLRGNPAESKRVAIYMIGKFRLTDLLSEVCGFLGNPELSKDAYEVLKSFGPEAEHELIRYYLVASGNVRVSRTILHLLGNISSHETAGFLFSRLWSNSRQLRETALKRLIECKFKPSDEEKQRLINLISEVIDSVAWNLSVKSALESDNDDFLTDKIKLEIDRWEEFLFNILSVTYNDGPVSMIRESISGGTFESIAYAHEIIAVLVSDPVKTKLISLLDIISDEERIVNLPQPFPVETKQHTKLLEDLINCDYNLISIWTKACTLRSIARIDGMDMAESVTALLFSPAEIIREESAYLIARSDPDFYLSASMRIAGSVKTRLDRIINGTLDREEYIFEKVQFLANKIGVPVEDEFLSMAGEMKYIKNLDRESFSSSGGYIIWPLNDSKGSKDVHVIYSGDTDRLIWKYQNERILSFYLLPMNTVEEYLFQFPDKSYEVLKYIDNKEYECKES
jgi:ATP:ADP antiporter, AAA family